MKADVYYYPSGFGHIGVNIILSEEELIDNKEYRLEIYSRDNLSHDDGRTDTSITDRDKADARRRYCPIIILDDNGVYSIYGYKDGRWQETPLIDLSLEEQTLLHSLNFKLVTTRENGKYFKGGFQNSSWQKIPCPEDFSYRYCDYPSGFSVVIKPSDALYKLIQKGHPEFRRSEYFYDLGGTFDLEENRKNRGEPIRIALPPSPKTWPDFYEDTRITGHMFFKDDVEVLSYNTFTYNCAHVSMDILHLAGYLPEKPDNQFALLPVTAAMKACDLAHQARAEFRKQLTETAVKTDKKQLINTLIEQSKNRLDDAINFNYGYYIGDCPKDLEYLSQIEYDESCDSIERMLLVSEKVSPHLARELNDCIALLDPEACLFLSIRRLEEVANGLQNNNARTLQGIAYQLRCEFDSFHEKKISGETFIQNASALLLQAEPILESEQNISLVILKNIGLAVCGLVVFYLVAALINQANSGNFMFFKEPSLLQVSANIQNSMPGLCI